ALEDERLSTYPEDVVHGVESRTAAHHPACGAQRPRHKVLARRGAMGEFEALPLPEKEHRVLTGIVSPAQRLHSDRRGRPCAGLAGACGDERLLGRSTA